MFETTKHDSKRRPFAEVMTLSSWRILLAWIVFSLSPAITVNAQDWLVIKSKLMDEESAFQGAHGVTRVDQEILTDSKIFEKALPIRNAEMQVRNKDKEFRGIVIGTTNDYSERFDVQLIKGRFLTNADTRNRTSVACIGKQIAMKLFDDADAIGRFVRVEKNYFEIIGIVESKKPTDNVKIEKSLIVPITTMKSRLGDRLILRTDGRFQVREYQLSELHLRVKKSVSFESSRQLVERVLKTNHNKQDYEVLVDED